MTSSPKGMLSVLATVWEGRVVPSVWALPLSCRRDERFQGHVIFEGMAQTTNIVT